MKIEQDFWNPSSGWQSRSDKVLSDKAQLVFLFGERPFLKDPKVIQDVRKLYPRAHLLGCSTAGQIMGTQVYDDALILTAVFFERTALQVEKINMPPGGSRLVGEQLAGRFQKDRLKHVFLLSEGLHVNGTELAKAFSNVLPAPVVVTGGLAGDQDLFEETLILLDGYAEKDLVAAVGFYGDDLKVGYGSMGGWNSFGPERLVTSSQGNVLYELDGCSALELYKRYLGPHAQGLPATGLLFPLSVRIENNEQRLVRTILSVDEQNGSMTFAGDIPQGSYAQLMKANLESLVDGASGAAEMCVETSSLPRVELAILISCVGRKLVLKQRVEEEIEAVREKLGPQAFLTGFYSYGEICPWGSAEKGCELHNQTMTITTFYEDVR
ncbi:MAG TPA: FIST C-terminal domain-containing protein [Candidatus Omnitrophota bacterium]|nr:FIST C-terminal domain-containing protein [Candidatus Omnitrophota bacterium]HQO59189.1 FIST C-terminal domain-containing protein [Candidatus Omnitrophota bacterium]